jgi:hypothetical protein
MRRAAKADRNQPEIVNMLRLVGCTVQHLHTIGKGCPDILVGYQGKNYVLELKDGTLPPSGRKLTDDEKKWHEDWRGEVHIVSNVREALDAIGISVSGWVS